MKRTINQKFEAGKAYHLDSIYDLQGLIPADAYEQDDISFTDVFSGDSGESVRFTKTVTVKATVTVETD